VQLKPGRVRFHISGFLNICMDFFMDFTEGIRYFRVAGNPSDMTAAGTSTFTTDSVIHGNHEYKIF